MFFNNLEELLWRVPALLIAITFHEYAHARMAYAWGDPTAKMQGRLTLNPVSHLDPIGTLMLLIAKFGWARPVPINPLNFRDQRRGLFFVSLAGPGMNLLIGLVAAFLLIKFASPWTPFYLFMFNVMLYNVYLAIFNIVPLSPLDGSKMLASLLPRRHLPYYYALEPYGPFILIILLLFGLLPVFLVPAASAIIGLYGFLINLLIP